MSNLLALFNLMAAASAPSRAGFVQTSSSAGTGSTEQTATWPATPTAGNLLVAVCTSDADITGTPSGWTVDSNSAPGGLRVAKCWKISDGTETGATFTSASIYASAWAFEYSNAEFGSTSTGTHSTDTGGPGGATEIVYGPSDSPASAGSLPLTTLVLGVTYALYGTATSPWVEGANGLSGKQLYQTSPPDTTASGTYVFSTPLASLSIPWTNTWIDPAGTAPAAISLVESLPSGTAGLPYTGSITGTNTGSATGTITYSADTLPDGISIDSSTGDVTGTPTTDTTTTAVTTTYTATNGTQSATYVQTWSIAAASTGPTLVQQKGNPSTTCPTSISITFDSAPTSGNLLVVAFAYYSAHVPNTPAGWTNDATAPANGSIAVKLFHKISNGTETTITFTLSSGNTGGVQGCVIAATEWSGASMGTATHGNSNFTSTGSTTAVGSTDAPVSSSAVPLMFYGCYAPPSSLSLPSPWTEGEFYTVYPSSSLCGDLMFATQPAPNAAVSGTVSRAPAPGSSVGIWMNAWIEP